MSEQKIKLENIKKSFDGRSVIDGFSAEISENTALMGASGDGKTTLARIIMGLEYCDSGDVSYEHKPIFSCVFQEDRLFEDFSATENVAIAYGKGMRREQAEKNAALLLSAMGISQDEQKKPTAAFSGGMKRRVALARALAKKADILVLDEPFKGLDSDTRERCAEVVRSSAGDALIILITHDRAEAELLGIENIICV